MIGEKLRVLLILEFSMIQRSSVPSLLSFWDEHFLHSWFDTEKPRGSSLLDSEGLTSADVLHCHEVIASEPVMIWGSVEMSTTSAERHSSAAISGNSASSAKSF
jgi:hypothetical protein